MKILFAIIACACVVSAWIQADPAQAAYHIGLANLAAMIALFHKD